MKRILIILFLMIILLTACELSGSKKEKTSVPEDWEVTPVLRQAVIIQDEAPLRDGPGESFGVIAKLAVDTQVTVTGQSLDSQWYQVEVPGEGEAQKGWVAAEAIAITDQTEEGTAAATSSPKGKTATVTLGPTLTDTPATTENATTGATQKPRAKSTPSPSPKKLPTVSPTKKPSATATEILLPTLPLPTLPKP